MRAARPWGSARLARFPHKAARLPAATADNLPSACAADTDRATAVVAFRAMFRSHRRAAPRWEKNTAARRGKTDRCADRRALRAIVRAPCKARYHRAAETLPAVNPATDCDATV